MLHRSVEETADRLGADARAYRRTFEPLVEAWPQLEGAVLGPLVRFPRHPFALAQFGLRAIWPAKRFASRTFEAEPARALFAGLAAHSILPLEKIASASFGLVLGLTGHAVGWPLPRGGSQSIADALASYLRSLGGEIVTGAPVESLDELSDARTVLCDVTPRQFLRLAGDRAGRPLPARARALPVRPGRLQARLGALGPDPLGGAGMRRRGHRSTSAARSTRSPRRSGLRRTGRRATGPSSCSRSPRCSIPLAHPRADTRRGRTATSPTARPST